MKLFFAFLGILPLVLANDVLLSSPEKITIDLDKDLVKELLEKVDDKLEVEKQASASLSAVINDFTDRLFKNVGAFAIKNNLDPVNLTDVKESILASSIKLTNGKLRGISTIKRTSDATISYISKEKTLDIFFPIEFSNLNFTYDYHVILFLVGPKGTFTGKLSNFRMDITFQFDFSTYQIKSLGIKTTNSGLISLTFEGNILDSVVNIFSQLRTLILHPLIVRVIQVIVNAVAENVVDNINQQLSLIFGQSAAAASLQDVYKLY